ncbi:MAG: 5'-nucleotidase C-terminal domain-containing protein [Flavobacteriaceae bacterium]|nr:5'-nucleotidase C-terminal domain-containing protein [Flavobacteriaceae bacterium]
MNYKHFYFLIIINVLFGCRSESQLTRIEGSRLEINDSLNDVPAIENFVAPYREHVNSNLDSVISYAPKTYSKTDGELNTAIGNLLVEAVYEQGNPIFKSRTGNDIDVVLLNHGGIRSIISEGDITKRSVYKILPFENILVVVKLKGIIMHELIDYLIKAERANPIGGLKIKVDQEFNLLEATINGEAIEDDKSYYVVTYDYLYYGGGNMDEFLQKGDSLYVLDYKVRNALMDYFMKTDTINPVIDDRFIKVN